MNSKYNLQISQLKIGESELNMKEINQIVGGIRYKPIPGTDELHEFFDMVGLPKVTLFEGTSRTSN